MAKASDYGIKTGETYKSRKGSSSSDRYVMWISASGEKIQYDGDAVRLGSNYPTTTADAFAKWAGMSASS